MRHYLFLSIAHAIEKYSKKEYDPEEVKEGWHEWRANLKADAINLPGQEDLSIWNGADEPNPPDIRVHEALDPAWPTIGEPRSVAFDWQLLRLHNSELEAQIQDLRTHNTAIEDQANHLGMRYTELEAWSKELLAIIGQRERELASIKRFPPLRFGLWMRQMVSGEFARPPLKETYPAVTDPDRISFPKDRTANVLFIVDRPNWAHDLKTRNLERVLGREYHFVKRFRFQVAEEDLDQADLIIVYFWMQIRELDQLKFAFARNRNKLLLGICSHYELEAERREPGLRTLRELPMAVFANNMLLYREWQPLANKPIFYTPNGVDTRFYRPAPAPVSRFPPWMSMHRPIGKVSPERKAQKRNLRVGWAGSLENMGPQQRGYYDLLVPAVQAVPGLYLVSAIREQKWRTPAEMLQFYRSLDIYLCASRSEGTPNPALEAAACGVPIVTTKVGNMPELVQSGVNGLFVDRSVESIAAVLRRLRDSPDLLARMSQAMLLSIQEWDWEVQADNYRRMFKLYFETSRLPLWPH